MFQQDVVRTIARSAGISLVGEGKTAADARRLASAKTPDIVILDITFPAPEIVRRLVYDFCDGGLRIVVSITGDDRLAAGQEDGRPARIRGVP